MPEHRTVSASRHVTAVLLLTALTTALYANSLPNGFTYDDKTMIVYNEMIKDVRLLPRVVSTVYSGEYRPLVQFSYAMDYRLWSLNPLGFHLTNIGLHLLNTIGVYVLFWILLGRMTAALPGAGLFAAHPVLTEAVDNIGSRDDLLATGLVFLALYCLLWSERSRRRWLAAGAGLGAYGLALFAKEVAVAFVVLLPLVDWAWGRFDRSRLPLYAGVAVMTAGYLILRFGVISVPRIWPHLPLEARLRIWPLATWTHLRLLVVPMNLSADYVLPIPTSWVDPAVMFPAAVIASLLLGLLWLWYREQRVACLGLLWIFVALGPVSDVIRVSFFVAERYLYLPAVGFALLLAIALTRLRSRALAVGLAALLLLTYSVLTIQRNPIWRDALSLWSDTVEKAPESPVAHNNLGTAYEALGDLTQAAREYRWAISLRPRYANAHNNLGWVYVKQGRLDLAAREFQDALRLNPHHAWALTGLGLVSQRQGHPEHAIPLYRAALSENPKATEVYANLGAAYLTVGRQALALETFQDGLRRNPREASLHNNLGNLYAEQGKLDEAVRAYQEALRIHPGLAEVHVNLGGVYEQQGRRVEAEAEYEAARRLTPSRR